MANIVPYSFPVELLSGTHNFASGGDTFKIALYTSTNPYTTSSTVYATGSGDEVSSGGGSQYPTGGNTLASQAVSKLHRTQYQIKAKKNQDLEHTELEMLITMNVHIPLPNPTRSLMRTSHLLS